MLLLRFHEVNNLLRWALARARVNIDRAGIEGYGHRSPWPTTNSIENSLSPNICHCFLQLAALYSWRIKLKKKKKEEEGKGEKRGRREPSQTRPDEAINISMIKQEQRSTINYGV